MEAQREKGVGMRREWCSEHVWDVLKVCVMFVCVKDRIGIVKATIALGNNVACNSMNPFLFSVKR